MLRYLLIVVICTILSLSAPTLAQRNETRPDNSTIGSGSGSGSPPDVRNCSELQCSHGCNETTSTCYCPIGYMLGEDMTTCQSCPGGLFGVGCSEECDCGTGGNTCDRINGSCICNRCYSGAQCGTDEGYECFVQFLGIADKRFDNLRGFYGLNGFPVPPMDRLRDLVAEGIMETSLDLIENVVLQEVNRTSVGQGPLIKLSWLVNRNENRPLAQTALEGLSDKVKLGNIRATYIAQDSEDGTTLVTINAGIKEEDDSDIDPV